MVSEYDDVQLAPGPNLRATFNKRLHIQGFIVYDRPENFQDWRAFAIPLISAGELHYREQIIEGLENAPSALLALLAGHNEAKIVVHVASPSLS